MQMMGVLELYDFLEYFVYILWHSSSSCYSISCLYFKKEISLM